MADNLGNMANILKVKPVGLDKVIHKIGGKIYELSEKLNVELQGYPRCYILQNEGEKKTIEARFDNGEYSRSLIFAEGNKFFFVSPEREVEVKKNYLETRIELYVIANTKECYPSILHKADKEIETEVLNVLWELTEVQNVEVESNIDKVFNRYNNRISQAYEYEYTDSMTDIHLFKVLIKLKPYEAQLENNRC